MQRSISSDEKFLGQEATIKGRANILHSYAFQKIDRNGRYHCKLHAPRWQRPRPLPAIAPQKSLWKPLGDSEDLCTSAIFLLMVLWRPIKQIKSSPRETILHLGRLHQTFPANSAAAYSAASIQFILQGRNYGNFKQSISRKKYPPQSLACQVRKCNP